MKSVDPPARSDAPRHTEAPIYFDAVRAEAARRWDQLEADPDLAAPWHQLFRQVQSPRHVISELLQNADDAGATWARVRLGDDDFLFEHDGRDFDEPSFRSLCRFGFSNKRHLHTIGFRGIGFKSTFSVGPRVELRTPTLRVAFDKQRFTEPVWLPRVHDGGRTTQVRIQIEGADVRPWLAEELERWGRDPLPILFFRNLQRMELQGVQVARTAAAPGPLPGSSWVRLQGLHEQVVLRIASDEEPFPPEALAEVRAERGDPDFALPPCRVELVVGAADPRLYVVLPTEVRVTLPFACNAPFLQDPARTGIKDPTGSPTNRWLLGRAGALAATALQRWVTNGDLSMRDRADAYAALLPKKPSVAVRSLAHDVEETVRGGTGAALQDRAFVLTTEGEVVRPGLALDLPPDLLGVWSPAMALALFGDGERAVLAAEVKADGRRRLEEWEFLKRFEPQTLFARLQRQPYPLRPTDHTSLVQLWSYVNGLLGQERHRRVRAGSLALVPATEDGGLYPADGVVVAGGSEDRLRPEDWSFIGALVPVADSGWIGLLRSAAERTDTDARLDGAVRLFQTLDLARRSGLHEAVFGAARRIFAREDPGDDGLRIARIAVRADLQVPDDFRFLCDDGTWRPVADGLLVDVENALTYFPLDWVAGRLVSARYGTEGTPREQAAWQTWARSPRSGLRQFVLPAESETRVFGRRRAEALIAERGGAKPTSYRLKSQRFDLEDYDFGNALWDGWDAQAEQDDAVWPTVIRGIQADWDGDWEKRSTARLRQEGNAYRYPVEHGVLAASWVQRLRGVRCLPDTTGRRRLPSELYRTNTTTAHLAGVEPFLAAEFDTEQAAPLLALLGVRDRPDSLDVLLDRVRALSGTDGAGGGRLRAVPGARPLRRPRRRGGARRSGGGLRRGGADP